MTEVTLHPLEVVPESELADLSAEVFGDEQPSELLAEVLAAEAAARGGQADERAQHTFELAAFRGSVPILARTAGLIAHLYEEIQDPIGFALSYQATREMVYEGDFPAGFGA